MNLMSKTNDETIEKIISLMQTDRSVDAPPDAVQWSKNLFRARAAEPKTSVVRKVLAVLRMDLSGARPAFGERSASGAPARQMFFQAGDNAIDIRLARSENEFYIRGQILGGDFSGCAVRLGEFEAELNEFGEFELMKIPNGVYNLSVLGNEEEIVVENLELI